MPPSANQKLIPVTVAASDARGRDWITPLLARADDRGGAAWLRPPRDTESGTAALDPGAESAPTHWIELRDRWARRWLITAALSLSALALGLLVWGVRAVLAANQPTPTVAPPALRVAAACAGVSGATVTDGPGDRDSAAGVIAAFEDAYYRQRSPQAAMTVVGPQAHIDPTSLASGISSIPPGTRHCVAVTPSTDQGADVRVVELRPDGTRTEYHQLITVTVAPGASLITGIQTRP